MDDGEGGDFVSLKGFNTDNLETSFLIDKGITKGKFYWFWYRAKNVNGWSGFSDIKYIQAATKPWRPPAPIFKTADATKIVITLLPTQDTRGSTIKTYKLYWNSGDNS